MAQYLTDIVEEDVIKCNVCRKQFVVAQSLQQSFLTYPSCAKFQSSIVSSSTTNCFVDV